MRAADGSVSEGRRPEATEDEALRAAVAESRQGEAAVQIFFLFLIYRAGQRACGCATARATGVGDAHRMP